MDLALNRFCKTSPFARLNGVKLWPYYILRLLMKPGSDQYDAQLSIVCNTRYMWVCM